MHQHPDPMRYARQMPGSTPARRPTRCAHTPASTQPSQAETPWQQDNEEENSKAQPRLPLLTISQGISQRCSCTACFHAYAFG